MDCPVCGGPMWSNAEKKASGEFKPNAADFVCKDKSCKKAVWLEKDGPKQTKASKPQAQHEASAYTLPQLSQLYDYCVCKAIGIVDKRMSPQAEKRPEDYLSAAATLFIGAQKAGLHVAADPD